MLSPYRVIDITDGGSMLCGQILADLGADVLLVEPPGGRDLRRAGPFARADSDPDESLAFWAMNRNKRSACLDIETDPDRAEFRRLVLGADILLESYPPGYLAERGLGYEDLARERPGLVVVSITPFGQSGPKASWPATDLTVTAASGVLVLTGDEDRAPLQISIPQAFCNASGEAAVGALLALAARERTGRGQHVDVSAQTAMMMTTQSFVLSEAWNDHAPQRVAGGMKLGDIRLRFVYPCKDGFVNVTLLFGKAVGPATGRLFGWMHEEGFVDEATRDKDWARFGGLLMTGAEPVSELARCIEAIERFTLSHTKTELFDEAWRRKALIVPLSDISDLLHSEQLRARDFWVDVHHPELGRTVTYPGPFARLSATPLQYRRRPPLIGEHTAEALAEAPRVRPPADGVEGAAKGDGSGALAGVKVLDFTWVYAGPATTRYLADHGATVVRVESATRVDALRASQPFKDGRFGGERSGNYCNVNVGKLGLSLNMSKPEARAVALKLAKWADVVIENFSPRAMRAWGMDYESLRAIDAGLVMVSTCLNGQTGPQASLAGYGTMGAALSGFGYLTGWRDRAPASPFLAYTDYSAPKFIAATVLAALDHRRRTGQGQHIDCSQAETSIHFLGSAVLDYVINGTIAKADGNANPAYAPSGVYPVEGEDRWVALAAPTEAVWRRFAAAAGRGWESDPRFLTAEARMAHRAELDEAIAAWTVGRTVAELEQTLSAAGVPVHRVSTSADLAIDPQLEARGHWVNVEHELMGTVVVESSRMRLSGTPATAAWAGPVYGQHNVTVLREILGMDDDEISDLAASGALE